MKKRFLSFAVSIVLVWSSFGLAETVRFAVITDTQGDPINEAVLSQAVQQIMAGNLGVQFVIVTGDLVRGSNWGPSVADQFHRWREIAGPWYGSGFQGLKVYPVPGNHDQLDFLSYQNVWRGAFPELPDNGPAGDKKMTYSFEFGPCHFAMVNTSAPTPEGNHAVNLDWLAADLAGTNKPIKLVFGHEPAYPWGGRHVGSSLDARPGLRDQFWKLLSDNKVPAYFYGHLHSYDHWIKDGVHQICVGTTGADGPTHNFLVVEANETEVTVKVYYIETQQLYAESKLSDTAGVAQEDRVTPVVSATMDTTPTSPTDPLPCGTLLLILIGAFQVMGLQITGKNTCPCHPVKNVS
jgi:hypothetical protein